MNQNNGVIRYATVEDAPNLLTLLNKLDYPCELNAFETRLKIFLNNESYGIAVHEIKQEIVAFVAWSKTHLFVSNKVRFHIEALIVSENFRGKSIGKKLMLFVENLAKIYHPAIIDLTSGIRREKEGTHEFYKRLGYQNEGPMAKIYLRKEV